MKWKRDVLPALQWLGLMLLFLVGIQLVSAVLGHGPLAVLWHDFHCGDMGLGANC